MIRPTPILLFVYNRPWHTTRTVETLQANFLAAESELFIFSDHAKNKKEESAVRQVRSYIQKITGFKAIHIKERITNLGLARNLISGISECFATYDKVIVMEDDLVSSPDFLTFINDALNFYADDTRIASVTGYNFPINIPAHYKHQVYLSYRNSSWGWGTWRDRWTDVKWDIDKKEFLNDRAALNFFALGGEDLPGMMINQLNRKIDSWSIRFAFHSSKKNRFHLFPCVSRIQNIGLDNSGTHLGRTNRFNVSLNTDFTPVLFPKNITADPEITRNFYLLFKKSAFRRFVNLVRFSFKRKRTKNLL